MKKQALIIFSAVIYLFTVNSHAIQVKVITNAKNVLGVGFSVNGEKYGGMGSSYTNASAPVGMYTFGLRSGGDICCKMPNGKKSIYLKKNTTAFLQFKNNSCRLKLY